MEILGLSRDFRFWYRAVDSICFRQDFVWIQKLTCIFLKVISVYYLKVEVLKSTLLIFAVLFFTSTIFSQSLIGDSTIIWGRLKSAELTGNPPNSGCYISGQIRYFAGDTISVVGYEKCVSLDPNVVPRFFYLALYDTTTVFLPESSVAIFGKWRNVIPTLTSQDFYHLRVNSQNYFRNLKRERELKIIEARRVADSLEKVLIKLQDSLEVLRQKKLQEYSKRCELKGLGVFDCKAFDASEYTDGTGMEMTFYNPTKKIIKYVHATVVGYNAVNDPVIESGKTSHTLKCIGPIVPGDSGTYNFEYVWFTDVVETAKLTLIKVQYMDGTEKIISKPSEVIIPRELIKE